MWAVEASPGEFNAVIIIGKKIGGTGI